jgi:hypothetical protein
MKVLSGFLLASMLASSASAQTPKAQLPRFEDYPTKDIFSGVPAPPKIVTAIQRKYRTRIREGVEKGWGVLRDDKEQNHPGPNFAGRMIVVQWGCAAPCLRMAIVDAVTGEVFLPPLLGDNEFALPLLCIGNSVSSNPEIAFRQASRLMVIKATPDWLKARHHSYTHYYLWRDDRWILLYREPLD